MSTATTTPSSPASAQSLSSTSASTSTSTPPAAPPRPTISPSEILYTRYSPSDEPTLLPSIRSLISADLSEPYSIYVYRYFLYQWGDLCFLVRPSYNSELLFLSPRFSPKSYHWTAHKPDIKILLPPQAWHAQAMHNDILIGVIIAKLELHRGGPSLRGYIAMLAVKEQYRGMGIATKLATSAIEAMVERGAHEIALETEVTNIAAIKLYERLGFLRSKRLHRYYLSGNSAYRLMLYVKSPGLLQGGHCCGDHGDAELGDQEGHHHCEHSQGPAEERSEDDREPTKHGQAQMTR